MPYKRDTEFKGYRSSREQVFKSGTNRVEALARAIEEDTGESIDGRRALDYGCGIGRVVVPLAERCEHVYGIDISTAWLAEAAENAKLADVENVEWLPPEGLEQIIGKYDLVVSMHVFQHIPVAQAERIFARLVEGLAPGGVASLGVILRPDGAWRKALRYSWRSPLSKQSRRRTLRRPNPINMIRFWDLAFVYMLRNALTLERIGKLLADQGISNWSVRYNPGPNPKSFDAATVIFVKSRASEGGHSSADLE